MRTILGGFVLLTCAFPALVPIASAATIHVLPDGSGDVPTIADAYAMAVFGDIISLGDGTFYERDLVMKTAVALTSDSGDPARTMIDAEGLGRCLIGLSVTGAPSIRGITFVNGSHSDDGGLLLADHNNAGFSYCVFRNGSAARGGAVAMIGASDGHSPRFDRCRFESCSATQDGGAIWTRGVGSADDCEFVDNVAGRHGGAIYSLKVGTWGIRSEGTLYENNQAGGNGGAVYSVGGSGYIGSWFLSCEFIGNRATEGGAAHLTQFDAVGACRLINNEATTRGGALLLNGIVPDKEFSYYVWNTIARNRAGVEGGGIFVRGAVTELHLERCTFADNDAAIGSHFASDVTTSWGIMTHCVLAFGAAGGAAAGLGTLLTTCSDVYGNFGGDWVGPLSEQASSAGNFSEDPRFCNRIAADYTLEIGSPCFTPLPAGCGSGVIGAHGIGCGGTSSVPENPRVAMSWGRAKRIYR